MCKAIAAGKSYKDAFTAARVSKATFYAHLANDSDFSDRVKKAEQEYQDWYDSQLVVDCKRSLLELVQGYEWDETTTESALDKNGKMVGEWSNKHIQELTGKIETETKPGITLANVPDNLLAQVIDAINGK